MNFVGDLSEDAEEAYFATDADEAEQASIAQASHNAAQKNRAAKAEAKAAAAQAQAQMAAAQSQAAARIQAQMASHRMATPAPQQRYVAPASQYVPSSAFQMQTVTPAGWSDGCASPGNVACDSATGCDSMSGSKGLAKGFSLNGALSLCTKDGWARHEAILWFVQARDMIPLVTTAPAGQAPEIGLAGTEVVFGNEIDGDLSIGYRGDMGWYLSDNVGVGGRFWIMEDNGEDYSISGDGTAFSIGRPFYDDLANVENSLLIGSTIPGREFNGSVDINSEVALLGAEAYARLNFTCSKSCQLDFIGGFSYFQVDDSLTMRSTSIDTTSTRTLYDSFETENQFIGGQVGFEAVIKRGRWFARSLTKVHLGNMEQTVNIAGSASQDFGLGAVVNSTNGLYAHGNQGTYENEEFSFIPELNFKLGYKFREHVQMSVGYTFLYFDNTALVGDVIDRTIDPSNLFVNTTGTRPAFDFGDSGLWVQGLDLGIAITY